MTLNIKGPGGRFLGGAGGGSFGIGEKFSIEINLLSYADTTGFDQMNAAAKESQTIIQGTAGGQGELGDQAKKTSESIREEVAPIRSVSWDMILMGRSMSILNNTFLGNNQLVKDFTGLIYGAGAALRIYVAVRDIERVLLQREEVAKAKQIALNQAEAASYGEVAAAATSAAVAKGAASVAGFAVGGPGGFAAVEALGMMLTGFQHGGTIPSTGPYMLHKGETVIPAGGTTSIININMQTGGISSSVDVDRMLDAMALRMAQESRRRLGR